MVYNSKTVLVCMQHRGDREISTDSRVVNGEVPITYQLRESIKCPIDVSLAKDTYLKQDSDWTETLPKLDENSTFSEAVI